MPPVGMGGATRMISLIIVRKPPTKSLADGLGFRIELSLPVHITNEAILDLGFGCLHLKELIGSFTVGIFGSFFAHF